MSQAGRYIGPRSPSGRVSTPKVQHSFSVKKENNQLFASTSNQTTPLPQTHSQCSTFPTQPKTMKTPCNKILTNVFPEDCAGVVTGFLDPKDNATLLKTTKYTKTIAENNQNWKSFLKPELLKGIKQKEAFKLYENPKNRQEKYLPTNKLGMNYLRSQGPIFSNPLVLKFIAAGKVSVEEARILTEPPKLFGIFRKPKYRGVENSKGVEKYIDEGKLTIQEALNLTQSQASILDDATVQKYIVNDKLTIEQAVDMTPVFRLSFSDFVSNMVNGLIPFAVMTPIFFLFGPFSFIAVATIYLIGPILTKLMFNGIQRLLSPYPLQSVMYKIGLYRLSVQKYIDNKSISIDNLINLFVSQTRLVRCNPENLSLKSIQKRIDDNNNPFTVFDALRMSRWRAYWIAFMDSIKNRFI